MTSQISSLALLACLAFASPDANAQLKVSDFFVDLHDETRSGDIFASNTGQERMFVKISAEEVFDAGLETETVNAVSDPRELGLLVSPQRLVLEPGDEKRIRLLALETPESDRFYRVRITPVVGDVESDKMIGVKLMIAYASWVFVRPDGATPVISGKRDGDRILVRNDGTTHAELTGAKQCDAQGMSCQPVERVRVMPGQEKSILLPSPDNEDPIEFNVVYAGKADKAVF